MSPSFHDASRSFSTSREAKIIPFLVSAYLYPHSSGTAPVIPGLTGVSHRVRHYFMTDNMEFSMELHEHV